MISEGHDELGPIAVRVIPLHLAGAGDELGDELVIRQGVHQDDARGRENVLFKARPVLPGDDECPVGFTFADALDDAFPLVSPIGIVEGQFVFRDLFPPFISAADFSAR